MQKLLFIFLLAGLAVTSFFIGTSYQKIDHLSKPKLKDYQIELHFDTIWVWEGSRLVGTHIDPINGKHGNFIDSLIILDNL